jgi:hypothetical protein
MWARIEARCRELKFGRSQYFQMLVEWDLHFMHEIHAHKADGKWHLYPERPLEMESLKAAEDPPAEDIPPVKARRRRPRR